MMKEIEKKRILITVKAYPNPTKDYGEAVCCAGIDLSNNHLIRIYPVPFRELDSDHKFKKYSIIEVDCFKSSEDKRPESYSIICESIRVLKPIGTERGTWKTRKEIVLSSPAKSMCQLLIDSKDANISLGLVKPTDITFDFSRRILSNTTKRISRYVQSSLFKKSLDPIEEIPYLFYYCFKCDGLDNCPGHDLAIVDWEINQAFRFWRERYHSKDELIDKIKQKWLDISNTQKNDVYYFVGNMNRLRKVFMILGVFYPKL
jgi:hypothetical protein